MVSFISRTIVSLRTLSYGEIPNQHINSFSVCDKGFGIESGSTLPTGLTITASHSQSHRLPSHARLNNGASSWCSTSPAANYHLQFDFGRVVTITGIATQGSPITNDWVKEFYLDYGNAIDSLTNYQEDGTIKVFSNIVCF